MTTNPFQFDKTLLQTQLKAWPPLFADTSDINRGNYTIFTNSDGKQQWAYENQTLYR